MSSVGDFCVQYQERGLMVTVSVGFTQPPNNPACLGDVSPIIKLNSLLAGDHVPNGHQYHVMLAKASSRI